MITPFIRSAYRQRPKSWLNENTINIENFGGGMNNVEADNVINDNEASDTKNMRFVSSTLMEKRHGCTEITDYEALNGKIVWIDEYKPMLGDDQIVRATETEMYIGDDKVCDLQGRVSGVNFYGKYYFVDGHTLRYWDGTDVYQIIAEPVCYLSQRYSHSGGTAATMNFESIHPNIQAGDSVFILSSVTHPGADGNLFGSVSSVNRINNTVDITFNESLTAFYIDKGTPIFFYTPLSIDNYEGEVVNKTIDGVNYTWYQPCINQLADSDAGASYIPTAPSVIVTHKERLFVAGDNDQPHTVFMTNILSEYYFPSAHNIGVNPNGDNIVDMFVFDTALIIGRNEDMYALYGDSINSIKYGGEDFYLKKMDVSTGLMCKDCGALINNYYIYLGYDGRFYKLNTPTTLVEYLVTKPLPRKIDIYQEPFNLDSKDRLNLSTIAFYNHVLFNVDDDLIIVYSYDNMAWTYYTGMKSSALYTDGINFYIGSTEGKLLNYEYLTDVYSDCGEPIECLFAGKRFDLNAPAVYKYFKSFMLTSHAWDNIISSINVRFESDYFDMNFETPPVYNSTTTMFGGNTRNPETSVTGNSDAMRYPASYWEIDRFNNRNLYKSRWTNLDIRSRTLKAYFSNNNLDETMRVYGYSILLTQRDVR